MASLNLPLPAAQHFKPTQADQVLNHMLTIGPITGLDALYNYGCHRLAARINELRKRGYAISSRTVKTRHGARISSYSLTD